jgi:hypothetical protein
MVVRKIAFHGYHKSSRGKSVESRKRVGENRNFLAMQAIALQVIF